jgi:hypothetical protein
VTSLGVSKDDPLNTGILEHLSWYLSCVSTILELRDILCADQNLAWLESLFGLEKMQSCWRNNNLDLVGVKLELVKDLFGELWCELESSILFPVASH